MTGLQLDLLSFNGKEPLINSSFPRKRKSRLLIFMDARLRGHDKTPIIQSFLKTFFSVFSVISEYNLISIRFPPEEPHSHIPSAWPEFAPCNSDMLAIHGVQIASEALSDSEDS
jgi:hypothetical protein